MPLNNQRRAVYLIDLYLDSYGYYIEGSIADNGLEEAIEEEVE